jgi:hypothetical protein
MDARTGFLACEYLGFGGEHLPPSRIGVLASSDFRRELQEHFVVAEFGRIESLIELGQLFVGHFRKYAEAFARSSFDQS